MKIDIDCWFLIIQNLQDDYATLFNILMVDRMRFTMTIPVLYRLPFEPPKTLFKDGQNINNAFPKTGPLTSTKRLHLAVLLEISSGFSIRSNTLRPIWVQKLNTIPTCDYYSFVKELGWYNIHAKCELYLEIHANKIPGLWLPIEHSDKVLPFAEQFSCLKTLELGGDFSKEHSWKVAAEFVYRHRIKFPKLLKEIRMPKAELPNHWEAFIGLLKALESPEKLTIIPMRGHGQWLNLSELPVQGLKSLELLKYHWSSSEMARLISRCFGTLENLILKNVMDDLLSWSVEKSKTFRKENRLVLKKDRKQFGVLKSIDILGRNQLLMDTMNGFRDTIQEIQYRGCETEIQFRRQTFIQPRSNPLTIIPRITWPMRQLETLDIDHYNLQYDFLSMYCPVLKTLMIGKDCGAGNIEWTVPKTLRILSINYEAMHRFQPTCLMSCIHLEHLRLDNLGTKRSFESTINMSINLSGCCFPNLKTVHLAGSAAHWFQGQFLKYSPLLEKLHLQTDAVDDQARILDSQSFLKTDSWLSGDCYPNLKTLSLGNWIILPMDQPRLASFFGSKFSHGSIWSPPPPSTADSDPANISSPSNVSIGSSSSRRSILRSSRTSSMSLAMEFIDLYDYMTAETNHDTTNNNEINNSNNNEYNFYATSSLQERRQQEVDHPPRLLFPNLVELTLSSINYFPGMAQLIIDVMHQPRIEVLLLSGPQSTIAIDGTDFEKLPLPWEAEKWYQRKQQNWRQYYRHEYQFLDNQSLLHKNKNQWIPKRNPKLAPCVLVSGDLNQYQLRPMESRQSRADRWKEEQKMMQVTVPPPLYSLLDIF